MTLATACPKQKPPLDERSFQQLLAAAYVVQEHGRGLHGGEVQPKIAQIQPQIDDIQSQVRGGGLTVSEASRRITEYLLETLHAGGVSISLVTEGYLDCVAESGSPANVPGSSLASHSLVATERLKSGAIFDSVDAQTDIRLDCNMCSRLRVESLVAAPIFRCGEIAGLIEARWPRTNAFQETELSTIQLTADLLREMLEHKTPVRSEPQSQGEYSGQTATRPQAIAEPQREQVRAPNDAADVGGNNSVQAGRAEVGHAAELNTVAGDASNASPSCRVCGRAFRGEEAFCGYCSMPRLGANSSEGLQSKWASLWFIQKAKSSLQGMEGSAPDASNPTEQVASLTPESASLATGINANAPHYAEMSHDPNFSYFRPTAEEYRASADLVSLADEPSPSETSPGRMQFARRRLRLKDILLSLVAAALTFAVVSAWPSSRGQLTWFGSAMVRLGLAHAPASSPTYGNPNASVWVDVHSKLYYCDGSGLYGSTPDGHFSTQREAQLQSFEPAIGLACQ